MKLQAFVDDSRTGDANQPGGVFALAGYMASESEWIAFSNEWQAELNKDPKIDAFKMSHFSNRFGPWNDRLQLFRNITTDMRPKIGVFDQCSSPIEESRIRPIADCDSVKPK